MLEALACRDRDGACLLIDGEPSPLLRIVDDVIRVGNTRVSLDSALLAYKSGASLDAIVESYPSLSADEVTSVLEHYRQRPAFFDRYLEMQEGRAAALRREAERLYGDPGLKERLLARRKNA